MKKNEAIRREIRLPSVNRKKYQEKIQLKVLT